MIDREDIEQAIEIACGDRLGGVEIRNRRTPDDKDVQRFTARLKRFLRELDGDVSVIDLRVALEIDG